MRPILCLVLGFSCLCNGIFVQKQLSCENTDDNSFKIDCDKDGVIITQTDDVAGATSDGEWTAWFNDDHPSGSGDKETINDLWMYSGKPMQCNVEKSLKCRKFSALKVNFGDHFRSEHPELTLDGFGNRLQILFHEEGGIICLNDEQDDNGLNPRCADYKVQFFCKDADKWCCEDGEECINYQYNMNHDKRILSLLRRLLKTGNK